MSRIKQHHVDKDLKSNVAMNKENTALMVWTKEVFLSFMCVQG